VQLLPTHPDHPERTVVVHELTQAAFAPYATLPRPSGALAERLEDVEADLAAGGGLLAYTDDWSTPLCALRWRLEPDHLWVKRVSVHPDHQRRGVGDLLMDATQGIAVAHGRAEIRLGVRHGLDANRRWYERRSFRPARDHDDWTEYAAPVAPLALTAPATLWKYEHPDHLQAHFPVDVREKSGDGWWVAIPPFAAHQRGGTIVAIGSAEIVGWLPRDRWWTAWFTTGRQHVKVDICTPAIRRADGDFEFRDLCLDVVLRGDDPPLLVDEDEFEASAYAPGLARAARTAADEVLRLIADGAEPFASEGRRRLRP
jgi:ribosomal protein S18 acetylase RimI-like enzyme